MRAHLTFRHFHPRTVRATDALFRAKPWSGNEEQKMDKFTNWLRQVSQVYHTNTPSLQISDDEVTRELRGYYEQGHISLPKFSVLTLMHEFRHHLQREGIVSVTAFDREQDAINWSTSLFYTVRPTLFRSAVRAGTILYVSPEDLLATRRVDGNERRDTENSGV